MPLGCVPLSISRLHSPYASPGRRRAGDRALSAVALFCSDRLTGATTARLSVDLLQGSAFFSPRRVYFVMSFLELSWRRGSIALTFQASLPYVHMSIRSLFLSVDQSLQGVWYVTDSSFKRSHQPSNPTQLFTSPHPFAFAFPLILPDVSMRGRDRPDSANTQDAILMHSRPKSHSAKLNSARSQEGLFVFFFLPMTRHPRAVDKPSSGREFYVSGPLSSSSPLSLALSILCGARAPVTRLPVLEPYRYRNRTDGELGRARWVARSVCVVHMRTHGDRRVGRYVGRCRDAYVCHMYLRVYVQIAGDTGVLDVCMAVGPCEGRCFCSESAELSRDCPSGCSVGLDDEAGGDFFAWRVCFEGPPDTLYEGGIFNAALKFPPDFPNHPPEMKFLQDMWHPNSKPERHIVLLLLLLFTMYTRMHVHVYVHRRYAYNTSI